MIGGAIVIVVLVALNIVGIQESREAQHRARARRLRDAGRCSCSSASCSSSARASSSTTSTSGVAPTWANFLLAIPVGMIAYTGIETISNLAEEARDPSKTIPSSIRLVAVAVFAIYFTLPLIALSALPVELVDGQYQTLLGLPPDEGGFANDPVLGLVENLGISGTLQSVLEVYVGILAATILFIATNAGVIGASRITYSMAELPPAARGLPPAAPALQDALALARRLRRLRLDPRAACRDRRTSSARCTRSAPCSPSRSRTSR